MLLIMNQIKCRIISNDMMISIGAVHQSTVSAGDMWGNCCRAGNLSFSSFQFFPFVIYFFSFIIFFLIPDLFFLIRNFPEVVFH